MDSIRCPNYNGGGVSLFYVFLLLKITVKIGGAILRERDILKTRFVEMVQRGLSFCCLTLICLPRSLFPFGWIRPIFIWESSPYLFDIDCPLIRWKLSSGGIVLLQKGECPLCLSRLHWSSKVRGKLQRPVLVVKNSRPERVPVGHSDTLNRRVRERSLRRRTNQLTTRSFQPSTLCRRTTNKKRAKNGEDIS